MQIGPWLRKGDLVLIHGGDGKDRRWLALIMFKTLLNGNALKIGPWKGPDEAVGAYYLAGPNEATGENPPLAQIDYNSLCVGTGNPVIPPVFGDPLFDTGLGKIPYDFNLSMHRDHVLSHFKSHRNLECFILDNIEAFFPGGVICDDLMLAWFENLKWIGMTTIILGQSAEGMPKVFDSVIEISRASSNDQGFTLLVALQTKAKAYKPVTLEVCKDGDYGMCWR